jgi:hypothetical protein
MSQKEKAGGDGQTRLRRYVLRAVAKPGRLLRMRSSTSAAKASIRPHAPCIGPPTKDLAPWSRAVPSSSGPASASPTAAKGSGPVGAYRAQWVAGLLIAAFVVVATWKM